MKLRFSEAVVVDMGPDSRTAKWGSYQFPTIQKLENGVLLYTFNTGEDSERAYGKKSQGGGRFASYDNGKTWVPVDRAAFAGEGGIKLPSGDYITTGPWGAIPLEGLNLPEPVGKTTLNHVIYRLDEVSEDICLHTWQVNRRKAGTKEWKLEEVKLDWPEMTIRSFAGVLIPPEARGRMRQAPDGSLWMPHYYFAGFDKEDGHFIPYLCNYLFHSTDEGKTWDLVHYMPYYVNEEKECLANYEGYGENDFTVAPDGTLVRLIRTSCFAPSWLVRSTDGGKTWTEPEKFDDRGVWPCLLTLDCGVTLASYGRPGVRIRATKDPSCATWEEPVELVHTVGNGLPHAGYTIEDAATCGYTNMIALDDRTAAIVYTDFTIRDEYGTPRKSAMFRTVTVED